jgi:hypothetical protein
MEIALQIPDEFAELMLREGQDPARMALEAIAVDAYREHRLTGHQLQRLLGITSEHELDGFLKQRDVFLEYSDEEIDRERETSELLWQKRQEELARVAG